MLLRAAVLIQFYVIYVQHLSLISPPPLTLDCTTSQDDLNVQKMLFNYALSR